MLVGSTSTFVVAEVIQARVSAIKSNQTLSSKLTETGSNAVTISRETYHADLMDGVAMVSLTLFWCLLGLYSKNLAYRLYSSAKFLDMIRLHAKVNTNLNKSDLAPYRATPASFKYFGGRRTS